MFGSVQRLIMTILLFPFYTYLSCIEWLVRFIFKIVFLVIKMTERLPIVGSRVTSLLTRVENTKIMRWLLKSKND